MFSNVTGLFLTLPEETLKPEERGKEKIGEGRCEKYQTYDGGS
jgi:hypothetical protein